MKSITVESQGPIRGDLVVPGDKSITHRSLILGALTRQGTSEIENPSTAGDCASTISVLKKLGITVEEHGEEHSIFLKGGNFVAPVGPLDFGNSGTGLRLMAGALAPQPITAILDGDSSLRQRPMGRIIAPLRSMGADITGRDEDRYPPLHLRGQALYGIEFASPVSSAQVKSAILLAALKARGRTIFTEPLLSRDHTERMLPSFGVEIHYLESGVAIDGPQELKPAHITVPGDVSSAAFWVVGALIVPGSRITVHGVGLNPTRTGYLELLRKMGGKVSWRTLEERHGEPVGVIEAQHSRLLGISITGEMVPSCIDELPVLAVAAACAKGATTISGASELRFKESDRIASLAAGLSALGVRVEEKEDGMTIEGGVPLQGAEVESHGDHRIAMSLVIAALTAKGKTVIRDTESIDTSYPEFEETLSRLLRQE